MTNSNDQESLDLFTKSKLQKLDKEDLSLKGSIDQLIRTLVDIINKSPYYCTLSTCSGRITLIEKPRGQSNIKKGCRFILSCHTSMDLDDLMEAINIFSETSKNSHDSNKCLWLKFEPFILHVYCYNLEKASALLKIALDSGCRNSGITPCREKNRFMVGIRSTSSMEVPVHCGSAFSLDPSFISFICNEANERLSKNMAKLSKFESKVLETLHSSDEKQHLLSN